MTIKTTLGPLALAVALVIGPVSSRASAQETPKFLLEGDVAQAIVDKVRSHPTNPGQLSTADLSGYQAKRRAPICHDYKANARDYRICGFPPPSSGMLTVGQILGILQHTAAGGMPLTPLPKRSAWRTRGAWRRS